MIRDKLVDELYRIADLAYRHTLTRLNKDLDPPMSPEEMWIPLKRLEEKLEQYHLTMLLQSLFEQDVKVSKLEPKDEYEHFK